MSTIGSGLTTADKYTDKEVHKNPALEVVGWFALCPEDGPLPEHAAIHKQLTTIYVENGILLAVHPQAFNHLQSPKARLPISIYDSTSDGEQAAGESAMQVDNADTALRFRRVPFVVETDETEMIAINYVAKGAGSAAAVAQTQPKATLKSESSKSASNGASAGGQEAEHSRGPVLTAEEEDQIAGLTTRLNSIKMLQERLQLMSRLVKSTSPSYLSDQTVPLSPTSPTPEYLAPLRNIQALLSRLALLSPVSSAGTEALERAGQAQANDVALTSILATLGQDVQGLSELGRKFTRVEEQKSAKAKSRGGYAEEYNARSGFFNPGFSSDANALLM